VNPRITGLTLLALLALAFVVAGCGSAAPTPAQVAIAPTEAPAQVEPTVVPPTVVPPTATVEPTATAAPTDTPAPTEEPTQEPTAAPAAVADATNCIACHTDEAKLQELAVEEAPAETLSEGEG
jgi:mono/diheme cytochrome c family protein